MNGKNYIAAVVLIVVVALSGCAGGRTVVIGTRPAMPPLKVEVQPARPYRAAVWVPGHWVWKGKRKGYMWVPGHWRG